MKDETAYAIVKYLNGYLFVVEVGGFQDGYSDSVLTQLANKAKIHRVNEIVVEANFGDGMFTQLFKPILTSIYPCAIQEVKNTVQKEARIIDTLEPVMMRHKLIVHKQVIIDDYAIYEGNPSYSLFYQMTRLSRERGSLGHDDRIDAVTMAVAHWVEQMDLDENTGVSEMLEEALEIWMDPERGIMYTGNETLDRGSHNILKNF